MDPLAEKYKILSPYCYVANNPLRYIDLDGRKIGDPNSKGAKRMQTVLNKTETGKTIWAAMVKSERAIYIHYAVVDGGEVDDNIRSYLAKGRAQGENVTSTMYEKIIRGSEVTADDMEASWDLNEETGMATKTEAWDETHIIIDDEKLQTDAVIEGIMIGDEEKGRDIAEIELGGEEAVHSIQDYADFKNNKHEEEAKKEVEKMINEYLEEE